MHQGYCIFVPDSSSHESASPKTQFDIKSLFSNSLKNVEDKEYLNMKIMPWNTQEAA